MTLALESPTIETPALESTDADTSAAARGAAGNDEDALVRQYLPLVGHLVREVANRVPAHVNRDDLFSAAMYALALSAKSFDPARCVPFAQFASLRIRGALTDELRSMDWASRGVRTKARDVEATRTELTRTLGRVPSSAELADALGMSRSALGTIEYDAHRASVVRLQALSADETDEVLPSQNEGPESLLLRREELGYLRDAVAELPERLRTVVERYFFQQHKMADIARDLGVTESRISQLRSVALTMLREGMHAVDPTARPGRPTGTARAAANTEAYRAAVVSRSTLAGRLAATTVLGESRASHTLRVANF